jgi:ribokinase
MRTAVVGHLEWIEFGHVERVPRAGDIVHATDAWEEPGGGGAVASVQLARLAGDCTFYTALGDDEHGAWSRRRLEELGVQVEAVTRDEPTRRAVVFVDANGERTITTLGRRLHPTNADDLPWEGLDDVGAVYFTAGDVDALREGRRAKTLVATSRVSDLLAKAGLHLDAVVGSGNDPSEAFDANTLSHPPDLVVRTDSVRGGRFETSDGTSGSYDAVPPPGPIVDTYGAGDSFAAGLTFAIGSGLDVAEALQLAARCGAWCASGKGPYGNQLTAAEVEGPTRRTG